MISSDQTYYPLNQAHKVANYIADQLRPHCVRIDIGGSIRRLKSAVKDIEIICEPAKEFVQSGLFPDTGNMLVKKDFSEALALIQKKIIKGNVSGRYMQIITNSKLCPDIKLDLFMPLPQDYYRQFAIRTGSAEYVHEVVAVAWRRKGWTGVKDIGLRRISECDCHKDPRGKNIYTLRPGIKNPQLPPVWNSEAAFFTWLGLEYIDPQFREYNKHINQTA